MLANTATPAFLAPALVLLMFAHAATPMIFGPAHHSELFACAVVLDAHKSMLHRLFAAAAVENRRIDTPEKPRNVSRDGPFALKHVAAEHLDVKFVQRIACHEPGGQRKGDITSTPRGASFFSSLEARAARGGLRCACSPHVTADFLSACQ